MSSSTREFDAIVIGSGIGGLAAAAALSKRGRRVVVLERHVQLGGLTQTFRRNGYTFATGVHYVGGIGSGEGRNGTFGRLLRWLTRRQLGFAPVGSPYDVVRLPGFELPIEAPRRAYVARLKNTFPADAAAIDRFFRSCDQAQRANLALFAAKVVPRPLAPVVRRLCAGAIRHGYGTTTAQAVKGVRDPRLTAVLTARWGDYGLPPSRSPLAVHALVTGSFLAGAYYPVGGPANIAKALGRTVTAAGGVLRNRAAVAEIRVMGGRVRGVALANGEQVDAPVVISAMGARNTAAVLSDAAAADWRRAVEGLKSGLSYVSLYLGLRGDVRRHRPTPANVWIYESLDTGRTWEHPMHEDAPSIYVSFPSLKDPAHRHPERHTAEVLALCPWEAFSAWADSTPGQRPEEYETAKSRVSEILLAQFARHFPGLAALIDYTEVATPLSHAAHVAADRGAMYGLEMTAERMTDPGLGVRTPVPGLLLAGQDAVSPGIEGAFMSGFMAAASVEPRLWWKMLQRPSYADVGMHRRRVATTAEHAL